MAIGRHTDLELNPVGYFIFLAYLSLNKYLVYQVASATFKLLFSGWLRLSGWLSRLE